MLCMYVRMYVMMRYVMLYDVCMLCMYDILCVRVCMYVCMVRVHGFLFECCAAICYDMFWYVCMYRIMYVRMYVCMCDDADVVCALMVNMMAYVR